MNEAGLHIVFDSGIHGEIPSVPEIDLGGLVVKQALVEATLDQSYKSIVEATRLLVFFGTPHQGGNYANVGNVIAKIVRASSHKPKNDLLDGLMQQSVESTRRFEQARHLPETCLVVNFFEGMPYGKLGIIVDKSSATLNLPGTREKQVALNADHSNICKIESAEGAIGRLILGTIAMEIGRSLESHRHTNTQSSFEVPFSLQGVPASEHFIDRPFERAVLEQHLLPQHTDTPRRKIFVLHGLGGIGKTQIAIDFARRHKTRFSAVFWVNGRSEDQVQQSLAQCAERVPELRGTHPALASNSYDKCDIDAAVVAMLEWLARPENNKWLIIFDNVDQDVKQGGDTGKYDIRQYFPGDHGFILLTSRLSHLKQLGKSRLVTQVDPDLSRAIFREWHERELDETEPGYGALLDLLQGLPLALAQAAAYLRETGMNIDSYVQLYHDKWDDLMGNNDGSEATLIDYREGSIATTWAVSLAAIEATSADSVNILRLWASLHHGQFWHDLLSPIQDSEFAAPEWPTWLIELGREKIRFAQSMGLLLRYSMIQTLEGPQMTYTMHPVVHQWALYREKHHAREEYARLALMLIGTSASSRHPNGYWGPGQRLLPHAERCSWWLLESPVTCSTELFKEIPVLSSMVYLGNFLTDQDKFKDAEQMLNRTVDYAKELLGSEHPLTLRAVNFLGIAYFKQRKYVEAEEMFTRLLEGRSSALGPGHETILDVMNKLGVAQQAQGRLKEAEEMYNRVLTGYQSDIDDFRALQTFSNLVGVYRRQGKLKEAKELLARATEGYERWYGRDHIQRLRFLGNAGDLYVDSGELDEAEMMYRRSLEGYKEQIGRNHSSTLRAVLKLGKVCRMQSKLGEAEELFTWALDGYEKALGMYHQKTLNTMDSLAEVYRKQGKVDQAIEIWSETAQRCEWVLERDHPVVFKTLRMLRASHGVTGQIDQTGGNFVQESEANRRILGRDDTLTLYVQVIWSVGATYRTQGNAKEAEQMWKRALEDYKMLKPNSLGTLTKIYYLAKLYLHQNNLEEAEELFQQVLEGFEKVQEHDNVKAIAAARALGRVHKKQGKLDKAESMYNRALKGFEKTQGENDARTLWTLVGLGKIYISQGRFQDAEVMLTRAIRRSKETLIPDHAINLFAYASLGNLYVSQGEQGRAEEMWNLGLEECEREQGLADDSSLRFVLNLCILYEDQNRLGEAEKLYVRALEACTSATAPSLSLSLDIASRLGDVYSNTGRAQEAEYMYRRALEGYRREFGTMHSTSYSTLQSLNCLYTTQANSPTNPPDEIAINPPIESAVHPPQEPAVNTSNETADSLPNESGEPRRGVSRRIVERFRKLRLSGRHAE